MRTLWSTWWDERDERLARRYRDLLGHRRWLLSWATRRRPDGAGLFTARLSCPDFEETIVRPGRTRCQAIHRAVVSLERHLAETRNPRSNALSR